MNLAALMRSLGGTSRPVYVPQRRQFDAEMPDLPPDMASSSDYDPQDLDPTQGIGRREDLNQEMQGPQPATPIHEDLPMSGPPDVLTTEEKPRQWVQRLKAGAPGILRSALVGATSGTPGQIGTGNDIFGRLKAVQDDAQHQDILAYNRNRQIALDSQNDRLNRAKTIEQEARAQKELAEAQDRLKGKGTFEDKLAQFKKYMKRDPDERELGQMLGIYGPIYDTRSVEQEMLRSGYSPEEIAAYKVAQKKAMEQSKVAAPANTVESVRARAMSADLAKATAARDKAITDGDQEAAQRYQDQINQVINKDMPAWMQAKRPPEQRAIVNTAEGIFTVGKNTGESKPLQGPAVEGEEPKTLNPFRRPVSERQLPAGEARKSEVQAGINRVMADTRAWAKANRPGMSEAEISALAKKNALDFYQNDPTFQKHRNEIATGIDAGIRQEGTSSKIVGTEKAAAESAAMANDPARKQARQELLNERPGIPPRKDEITARVEQNKTRKSGGGGGVAGTSITANQVVTFRTAHPEFSQMSDEQIAQTLERNKPK